MMVMISDGSSWRTMMAVEVTSAKEAAVVSAAVAISQWRGRSTVDDGGL